MRIQSRKCHLVGCFEMLCEKETTCWAAVVRQGFNAGYPAAGGGAYLLLAGSWPGCGAPLDRVYTGLGRTTCPKLSAKAGELSAAERFE